MSNGTDLEPHRPTPTWTGRRAWTTALLGGAVVIGIGLLVTTGPERSVPLSAGAGTAASPTTGPTVAPDSPTTRPASDPPASDPPPSLAAPATDTTMPVRGTTVEPRAYEAPGEARVTLSCGDEPGTRRLESVEINTQVDGQRDLYWSEPAGLTHLLQVGDELPAGMRLGWAIRGVQQGPWLVDEIADSCDKPDPEPTIPTRYTVPPTSVTVAGEGYDPAWTARAVLACGDTATTRRIELFEAETNGAGPALLGQRDPATGLTTMLAPGDQFGLDRVLIWNIRGVYLGPWDVPEVADNC